MSLTTTREFRWDDPGAPTLNGTVGSFYALMKACLVGSGGIAYGSGAQAKPAAGWSIAFDDPGAQKIVFRNSMAHGGSGCYLRIVDNGSEAGGARIARIDGYESMSGIDSGTGHTGFSYVWKSVDATAASNAWTLHADERTAYWSIYTSGTAIAPGGTGMALRAAGGVGDYEPFTPGDPGCFVAGGELNSHSNAGVNANNPSSLLRAAASLGIASASALFSASRANDLTPAVSQLVLASFTSLGNSGIGGSNEMLPSSMRPSFVPALVCSGRALRGRMRGLFIPLNYWPTGSADVGTIHDAFGTASPLSLAALAGGVVNSSSGLGRLFVSRLDSWDDV